VQGKELSYNNLADLDAAVRAVFELDGPGAVIVKHANPCGAAIHPAGLAEAYELALSADPTSSYGGILALNRPVTDRDAQAIIASKVFFEVVGAPGFDAGALERFGRRPNLRVMDLPAGWATAHPAGRDLRRVQGGVLLQEWDSGHETAWEDRIRTPTTEERRALRFAWAVCKGVKSNAIVLARVEGDAVVLNGVGAGQMSRVDSVHLAIRKATRPVAGSVLASDAFFPFPDGVEAAADAGVIAVVQPGGSIRDEEVLAAARSRGLAMCLAGARHFRH
jgi:phosphoribosylaminoimidazolecarboxamide formyltransferase/IMP cyclohydrolase